MLLTECAFKDLINDILQEIDKTTSRLDSRTFKYYPILKEFLEYWNTNLNFLKPLLEYYNTTNELPKCKVCNAEHNRFIKQRLSKCCSYEF